MINTTVGATASQPSCPQFVFVFFSAIRECGKCLQGLFLSKTFRKERKETMKENVHTAGVNIEERNV